MTDEEKRAIAELENLVEYGLCYNITEDTQANFKTILNLIEKQENRIKELEEVAEYWRKEFERVLTESNLID